jgi:hypothetical protein
LQSRYGDPSATVRKAALRISAQISSAVEGIRASIAKDNCSKVLVSTEAPTAH